MAIQRVSIEKKAQPKTTITAGQVLGIAWGNTLEFYDFIIFSFFAVQIGRTFFPADSPVASLLATLATFGAGYMTRPLGAVVLGGFGDRIGRKPAVVLSLALIGVATLGLSLVPAYTSIGIGAPVLVILCRLIQGFALGGEVGASTALLVEAAPAARRGVYVSLQYVGQGAAALAAGMVGVLLSMMVSDDALTRWGWRIAFGLGVIVFPIGLVLRGTLAETRDRDGAAAEGPPVMGYARTIVIAFVSLSSASIVSLTLNYMTTYATTSLKLGSSVAFGATMANGVAWMASALIAGWWSDRFGRRPIMIWPMVIGTIGILPGFWLMIQAPGAFTLWPICFLLRFATMASATAALISMAESFPSRVRSRSVAIVYALAVSTFGGTTQFAVAWLTNWTGNLLAPAWYMFGAAVIGTVSMLLATESSPVSGRRS